MQSNKQKNTSLTPHKTTAISGVTQDGTPSSINAMGLPPKKISVYSQQHLNNPITQNYSTSSQGAHHSKDDPTQLKMQIDTLSRELEDVKLENERFREKVEELEKWIILLTNNFYAGTPSNIEAIQKGLATIDEQRNQLFSMKKALLFEKKKYMDLQQNYQTQQKRMREREEILKQNADPSQKCELLVLQRQALEENLRLLSDEVESLSQTNARLLKDLKIRDFYQQYYTVVEELNKLKTAHMQLITLSRPGSHSINNSMSVGGNAANIIPNNVISITEPVSNNTQRSSQGIDYQVRINGPSSQQHLGKPLSKKFDQLISFISCQGGVGMGNCQNGGGSFSKNNSFQQQFLHPVNEKQYHHNKSRDDAFEMGGLVEGRDDFEAIITANDVNFLAVNHNQNNHQLRSGHLDHRYTGGSQKRSSLIGNSGAKSSAAAYSPVNKNTHGNLQSYKHSQR